MVGTAGAIDARLDGDVYEIDAAIQHDVTDIDGIVGQHVSLPRRVELGRDRLLETSPRSRRAITSSTTPKPWP